jgi:arylsulfatase A-like enzyme
MDANKVNFLLVMLDQSRNFRWFPDFVDEILPARERMSQEGINFRNFYANSSPCSPNRATIFTGLYAHQHWILDNCNHFLSLDRSFPTIGKALQSIGYRTFYFGKWHLTSPDHWPSNEMPEQALSRYGFDTWRPQNQNTPRDYISGFQEGLKWDRLIMDSAINWLKSEEANNSKDGPWFTVVSLVNPHDITNYPSFKTNNFIDEMNKIDIDFDFILNLPDNFESLQNIRDKKPQVQYAYARGFLQKFRKIFGESGNNIWIDYLNYYLFLESMADDQIARLLDALQDNQQVKSKTILIFTSDHGELGGSHGLKGKMATMYEEQMNIPFILCDYTQNFVHPEAAGSYRDQLYSSIDIFPTILSFCDDKKIIQAYDYLPGKSLKPALQDPKEGGHPYLISTFDRPSPRNLSSLNPAWHIASYRNRSQKFNLYSHWNWESLMPVTEGQEFELYDLETTEGRLEIDNVAARTPETKRLREFLVNDVFPNKLRSALGEYAGPTQRNAEGSYREHVARSASYIRHQS